MRAFLLALLLALFWTGGARATVLCSAADDRQQARDIVAGVPSGASYLTNSIGCANVTNEQDVAWLQAQGFSVLPFDVSSMVTFHGAYCDGSHDDTNAIQAEINNGNVITFPPGTCQINGTLTLSHSNIAFKGSGQGITTLHFGASTADAIQIGTFPNEANCTGTSQPANCGKLSSITMSDVLIDASARTGGFAINIWGLNNSYFDRLFIKGWRIFNLDYFNNLSFSNIVGNGNDTNQEGLVYLKQNVLSPAGSHYYRSDVVAFNDVTIQGQNLGGIDFVWDGPINTVRAKHLVLLGSYNGMEIDNSAQSTSLIPTFLFANDLEIDGASHDGLLINALYDADISNSDIDILNNASNTSGTGAVVINPDSSFSITRRINISNSRIHDCPGECFITNARNVRLTGVLVEDTNKAGSGAFPAVEIGANSDNTTIAGSTLGYAFADSFFPTYGVTVDSGAAHTMLGGNNYYKATTGNVNNLSGQTISFFGGIDRNGAAITVNTCANVTAC